VVARRNARLLRSFPYAHVRQSGGPLGFSRPCCGVNGAAAIGAGPQRIAVHSWCPGFGGHRPQLRFRAKAGMFAPNKSFKPKPLRGSVQTCCTCWRVGSLPFTLRFGLTLALGGCCW
jgi:hypothetical protein